MDSATSSPSPAPSVDSSTGLRLVTTSEFHKHMEQIVESTSRAQECIVLTNHSKPQAVLVPYETYLELVRVKSQGLAVDFLTDHCEQVALSMNTPSARAAAKEAFNAGPEVFRSRPLQRKNVRSS
jgi:prevent-host-death family protein